MKPRARHIALTAKDDGNVIILAYFHGEKQVLSPSVGDSSNIERRFQDLVIKKMTKTYYNNKWKHGLSHILLLRPADSNS